MPWLFRNGLVSHDCRIAHDLESLLPVQLVGFPRHLRFPFERRRPRPSAEQPSCHLRII